ncbi:transposase [Paramagnetospirillum caucaseum]|uniref:Transposase n=1 Tax=Paramagnetospirillum caucaseum TaxID=1244869 RepID=M3A9W5_9PROT|nr:transposase [Paramagnetospirillum caucaseum]
MAEAIWPARNRHDDSRPGAGGAAGGDRAAAVYTLIETDTPTGRDPEAYLRDVIGRIADHPINRIADLLPWTIGAPASIPAAA